MIVEAIDFAAKAHKGTFRKGTHQPYIFHPLEVLSLISMMTEDEEILCAAVLHDTVEDTNTTIEDVRSKFGDRVAKLVSSETEDKRGQVNKQGTWIERKQEAIDAIKASTDKGSKMICLCDKVSNLRSFHLLLLQNGEDAWNNFNMKDPTKHYWYYNELAKSLSEFSNEAVYKEYLFLIDSIFSKYLKEKNNEQ